MIATIQPAPGVREAFDALGSAAVDVSRAMDALAKVAREAATPALRRFRDDMNAGICDDLGVKRTKKQAKLARYRKRWLAMVGAEDEVVYE